MVFFLLLFVPHKNAPPEYKIITLLLLPNENMLTKNKTTTTHTYTNRKNDTNKNENKHQ